MIKIPITYKNRNCSDDFAVILYDNFGTGNITYNNKLFKVTIYHDKINQDIYLTFNANVFSPVYETYKKPSSSTLSS